MSGLPSAAAVIGRRRAERDRLLGLAEVFVVLDGLPHGTTERHRSVGLPPARVEVVAWTPHEWRLELSRGNPVVRECLASGVWLRGSAAALAAGTAGRGEQGRRPLPPGVRAPGARVSSVSARERSVSVLERGWCGDRRRPRSEPGGEAGDGRRAAGRRRLLGLAEARRPGARPRHHRDLLDAADRASRTDRSAVGTDDASGCVGRHTGAHRDPASPVDPAGPITHHDHVAHHGPADSGRQERPTTDHRTDPDDGAAPYAHHRYLSSPDVRFRATPHLGRTTVLSPSADNDAPSGAAAHPHTAAGTDPDPIDAARPGASTAGTPHPDATTDTAHAHATAPDVPGAAHPHALPSLVAVTGAAARSVGVSAGRVAEQHPSRAASRPDGIGHSRAVAAVIGPRGTSHPEDRARRSSLLQRLQGAHTVQR